jgi:hypothetical protein
VNDSPLLQLHKGIESLEHTKDGDMLSFTKEFKVYNSPKK